MRVKAVKGANDFYVIDTPEERRRRQKKKGGGGLTNCTRGTAVGIKTQ